VGGGVMWGMMRACDVWAWCGGMMWGWGAYEVDGMPWGPLCAPGAGPAAPRGLQAGPGAPAAEGAFTAPHLAAQEVARLAAALGDGPREARLDGRDVLGKIVAVEAQPRLQPQRVAGAEAGEAHLFGGGVVGGAGGGGGVSSGLLGGGLGGMAWGRAGVGRGRGVWDGLRAGGRWDAPLQDSWLLRWQRAAAAAAAAGAAMA
jgi:hypothetical protein